MNRKEEQLAASMRRILGELIGRGLSDPRIKGMVSITELQLVAKGRVANVHISVLPQSEGPLSVKGLQNAAKHLRGKVGAALGLRVCPKLKFVLDGSLKSEADILGAIREAVESDTELPPISADSGDEQER
jgi:ribosome-binding factor A